MTSEDPAEWLPQLLGEDWALAVEELLAAGKDVPVKEPPSILGARRAASTKNAAVLKVYRIGPRQSRPQSWGDTDRDLAVQYAIDIQASGDRSIPHARSAEMVVDRILSRHRVWPNAAWERFEAWESANPVSYFDGQHIVFTVTLAVRGQVMPVPVKDR